MSLFDKFKNMFTEEVEVDEVKVEKVESDINKTKVELPKKEEVSEQRLRNFSNLNDTVKEEDSVKKPVFFTDKDFDDLLSKPKKEEPKELYKENSRSSYNIHKPEKVEEEKKIFKPTPIISPVYGILDKNYHKEDIVSKREPAKTVSTDGLSVDSVRNKAYGTLEDELENTLFGQNSILFNDKVKEEEKEESDFFEELEKETKPDILDELKEESSETTIEELDEITMDIEKELDSILNKKEKRDNNKKEIDDNLKEDDLFELIDSMYEGEDK